MLSLHYHKPPLFLSWAKPSVLFRSAILTGVSAAAMYTSATLPSSTVFTHIPKSMIYSSVLPLQWGFEPTFPNHCRRLHPQSCELVRCLFAFQGCWTVCFKCDSALQGDPKFPRWLNLEFYDYGSLLPLWSGMNFLYVNYRVLNSLMSNLSSLRKLSNRLYANFFLVTCQSSHWYPWW